MQISLKAFNITLTVLVMAVSLPGLSFAQPAENTETIQYPKEVERMFNRGKNYFERGKIYKARDIFFKVLKMYPFHTPSQEYLRKISAQIQDEQRSETRPSEAAADTPPVQPSSAPQPVSRKEAEPWAKKQEKVEILYEQAKMFYDKGDMERSAEIFRMILELNPKHYPAKEYLKKIEEPPPQEVPAEQKDAVPASDDGLAGKIVQRHLKTGEALFYKNKFKDALDEFKKVLILDPDNESARNMTTNIENILRTKEEIKDKGIPVSSEGLSEAESPVQPVKSVPPDISQVPEQVKLISDQEVQLKEMLSKAEAYYKKEEKDKAKEVLIKILTINPTYTPAQIYLEEINKEFQQPAEDQTRERYINAYIQEGMKQYMDGEKSRAVETWKRILKVDPGNRQALELIDKAQGELKAATSGGGSENTVVVPAFQDGVPPPSGVPSEAESVLRSFEDTKNIEKYLSQAERYMKQGEYELVISECARVLSLDPNNAKAMDLSKKAYQKQRVFNPRW